MGTAFCLLATFVCSTAASVDSKPVTLDVSLSESSILSGAPVDIVFTVTCLKESGVSILLSEYARYGDERLIIDLRAADDGTLCPRRPLISRPPRQDYLLPFVELSNGESATVSYPLHRQFSTRVASGLYLVTFPSLALKVPSGEIGQWRKLQLPIPSLELTIQSENDEALKSVYQKLLEEAVRGYEAITGTFYLKAGDHLYPTSCKALLWAYDRVAVPYQIDLLRPPNGLCRFMRTARVHAYQNIVEHAEEQETRRLVDIALDGGFHPDYKNGIYFCKQLLWAIQELHRRGGEEIQDMTKEVIERFPEPVDIKFVESLFYD